jgi:hypothetical protein
MSTGHCRVGYSNLCNSSLSSYKASLEKQKRARPSFCHPILYGRKAGRQEGQVLPSFQQGRQGGKADVINT